MKTKIVLSSCIFAKLSMEAVKLYLSKKGLPIKDDMDLIPNFMGITFDRLDPILIQVTRTHLNG